MTVQRRYLQEVKGVTYKYERSPIAEEMPIIKIDSKKWFLWRRSKYRWVYVGYYDTKADMLAEMSK